LRLTINRNVIVEQVDSLEELTIIILYSLIISHGIRVDTRLWLVRDQETVYVLEGYNLRHLYPHKKSLEGFVKKVVMRNRNVPGTKLYPYSVIKYLINEADLTIVNSKHIHSINYIHHPLLKIPFKTHYNIVIDFNGNADDTVDHVIVINDDYIPSFITKAHYLIDVIIGGWVRRHGGIEYYRSIIQ